MSCLTITKGSKSVDVDAIKVSRKIQKKWQIQPIAVPPNRRAETTTTGALAAGNNGLHVASATNLQANDTIFISGDLAGEYHSETQTILEIVGTTVTLNGTLQYGYDVGATIIKLVRFVSFDFNTIVWTITVDGWIDETDSATVEKVATTLETLTAAGGTVTAYFDTNKRNYEEVAITQLVIDELPEGAAAPTKYKVNIVLTLTNKERGT